MRDHLSWNFETLSNDHIIWAKEGFVLKFRLHVFVVVLISEFGRIKMIAPFAPTWFIGIVSHLTALIPTCLCSSALGLSPAVNLYLTLDEGICVGNHTKCLINRRSTDTHFASIEDRSPLFIELHSIFYFCVRIYNLNMFQKFADLYISLSSLYLVFQVW